MDQQNLLTQGWKKLQFQIGNIESGAAIAAPAGGSPQPLPADEPSRGSWSGGSAASFSTAIPSAGWDSSASQAIAGGRASMESEILAHAELEKIAKAIAIDIESLRLNKLTIHSEQDLAGLTALQTFLLQMQLIQEQYEAIVSVAAPPTPLAAENVIEKGSSYLAIFNDIAKLLKVDVDIKTSEITMDEVTLASEVIRHISPNISIYYPGLVPAFTFKELQSGEIQKRFSEVRNARNQAEVTAKDDILKKYVHALNSEFDTLQAELLKRDPQTGLMPLTVLLRAQGLRTALGENGGILYLKVMRAGGSTRTIRSLWTLFTGPQIQSTGACIATYFVFDRDGRALRSQTLYSHSGFDDIASFNSKNNIPKNNDNLPEKKAEQKNANQEKLSPVPP